VAATAGVNKLYVGFAKEVELPKTGCLLIDDETRDVPEWRRPKLFDPLKHSFNPLEGLDYKRARELAEVLYTISPQGENTLTVRNGKRALLKSLLASKRLDELETEKGKRWERTQEPDEEVRGMVADLLASPVLKRVFCEQPNFTFTKGSVIQARLNRAEFGEFDALVLGLFLISHYKGQLVIPDFGFYGREQHASLIREKRLIAGVNFLAELPDKLRRAVLLIESKEGKRTTAEDAETLASYAGLIRGTNGYNSFVAGAMGVSEV